jgi:hypothetical protein
MIEFSDGSTLDAKSWQRMLNIAQQKQVEKIVSGGVNIKVGNLKAKKKVAEHENYIESTYKNKWKIRVWKIKIKADNMYGVNCFCDPAKAHYLEFCCDDFQDENGVFKCVENLIDNKKLK